MSFEKHPSIFILKSRVELHRNVETFLKNRKWKVESATNIRDALSIIFGLKPDVIMIPSDHPNKKVRLLPQMLLETFSAQVITYCDSETKISIASLQEMGTEYILFPPISGPSIERLVLKDKKREKADRPVHVKGQTKSPVIDQLWALANDEDGGLGTFVDKGEKAKLHQAKETSPKADLKSATEKGPTAPKMEYQLPREKKLPARLTDPQYFESLNQISQSVQSALQESLPKMASADSFENVSEISKCSCLQVKSENLSGYLLAALGKSRLLHLDFIESFRQNLGQALASGNKNLKLEGSPLELQLNEVAFESWATDQADFVKKSVLGNAELILAFFPADSAAFEHPPGPSPEMLAFKVPELKASLKVPCNLYLHLPENGKYLLYLAKGRPFTPEQQDRLAKNGISLMYFAKDEKLWIHQYKAENTLNEKIEAFQTNLSQESLR